MKLSLLAAALLVIVPRATGVLADAPSDHDNEPPSHLGFLAADKDYVIKFPPAHEMFKATKAGISATTHERPDGTKTSGKPATWTMTMTVEVFHIVRFGGGSWVLLEHPADSDDIAKWNAKRRAMAQLAVALSRNGEEVDAEANERLEKIEKAAGQEIETSQTWINLDHAIAIAPVPTDDGKLRLRVESIERKTGK